MSPFRFRGRSLKVSEVPSPLPTETSLLTWTDIDQSRSAKVRLVWNWWNSARGSRDLPDRGYLDPADLKSLLPSLIVAEAEHQPFRIRYRLVGTLVAQFSGFDFTGRYFDETWGEATTKPWLDCYRRVCERRMPLFGSSTEPTTAGDTISYEFGLFPLTRGGDAVEQFVGVEDYFDFQLTSAQWSDGRLVVAGSRYH